ncbi:MAG: hypothetical protein GF308_12095 [Candidatus Heimdallarchaeota archaeon]|nr:hypothetical protein [Candidatus Heimdallarchaeota archaeon]
MKFVKVDEKKLNRICCSILQAIRQVFTDELICLVLHGSAIKGGFIEGFSDIDLQLFLTEAAFDEFGLKLSRAITLQKLIGKIDLNPIKAYYIQLIYLRPPQIPLWYTPPLQRSFKVLYGELPKVIWTKAKDEVLSLFCEKYTGEVIESYLRNVFQQIILLGKVPNDCILARKAFTNSINFLKEAAKIGDSL